MHVMIVGGGIGGLAAALSLHAAGVTATVFEQVREPRELGVGINTLPHAIKELAALGLLPELDRAGIRTRDPPRSHRTSVHGGRAAGAPGQCLHAVHGAPRSQERALAQPACLPAQESLMLAGDQVMDHRTRKRVANMMHLDQTCPVLGPGRAQTCILSTPMASGLDSERQGDGRSPQGTT